MRDRKSEWPITNIAISRCFELLCCGLSKFEYPLHISNREGDSFGVGRKGHFGTSENGIGKDRRISHSTLAKDSHFKEIRHRFVNDVDRLQIEARLLVLL